ncbi:calcium/proton exchanger [Cladophialophora immunda]|uniref:Calcium/proton exchanger n=1 Tax=Cladophialophora immunda TaxID=569365 RepID=A0A0D2AAZ0_9EURO|nr:calcium/proton exchanger [Cladophialophora immunda]KIW21932.1 calcium/proton exchanger [Cladophialophora immunda]
MWDKLSLSRGRWAALAQYACLPWGAFLLTTLLTPFAIVSPFCFRSDLATFCLNLAALCAASTLLRKASPEIIFAVIAVIKHESIIAQTAIVGAILCNLLLVVGSCFLIGSRPDQRGDFEDFPQLLAQTNSQLLMTGLGSLVIPTAYSAWSEDRSQDVVALSRALAIVMLILYGCIFWFFHGSDTEVRGTAGVVLVGVVAMAPAATETATNLSKRLAIEFRRHLRTLQLHLQPITVTVGAVMAAAITVFTSLFVVETSGAPAESLHVTKSFLGLVVVPFLLQLSDHIVGAMHASKHEISWIISTSMRASCQQYFLVLPVAVLTGWAVGDAQITLLFDGLQMMSLLFSGLLIALFLAGSTVYWWVVNLLPRDLRGDY